MCLSANSVTSGMILKRTVILDESLSSQSLVPKFTNKNILLEWTFGTTIPYSPVYIFNDHTKFLNKSIGAYKYFTKVIKTP